MVAVKDRMNALKNPYAHLKLADISMEIGEGVPDAVGSAPLPGVVPVLGRRLPRWWFTDRAGGDGARPGGRPPAWIPAWPCARSPRCSPAATRCTPRRAADCAADVYRQAGITRTRASRSTWPRLYVPFSWYEPMWLEAHRIVRAGRGMEDDPGRATSMIEGGDIPVEHVGRRPVVQPDRRLRHACASGGSLAGARHGGRAPSGRGPVALGQAYGAAAQYFSHVGRRQFSRSVRVRRQK